MLVSESKSLIESIKPTELKVKELLALSKPVVVFVP